MIAIKDMEIPDCCATCHISEVICKHKKTAFVRYSIEDFAIPNDCPLVEIVTCKDCKYCELITDDLLYKGQYRCKRHCGQLVNKLDWYCADAERRK